MEKYFRGKCEPTPSRFACCRRVLPPALLRGRGAGATSWTRLRPTSALVSPAVALRAAPAGEQRVGQVFVFSLTAALNPTLLTAVTVMLTLEKPQRLLLGYLLGALVTSITCGLLLVFALPGSGTSSTAKHGVNPVLNIALGALVLVIVFVVATGRDTTAAGLERAQTRASQGQNTAPLAAPTEQGLRPRHVRRRGAAQLPGGVLHRRDGSAAQTADRDRGNRHRRPRVQPDHAHAC